MWFQNCILFANFALFLCWGLTSPSNFFHSYHGRQLSYHTVCSWASSLAVHMYKVRPRKSTRPLIFTSASGCKASEKFIFLVKIKFFPIYANSFCNAGQVPVLRYFEAWNWFLPSSVIYPTWIRIRERKISIKLCDNTRVWTHHPSSIVHRSQLPIHLSTDWAEVNILSLGCKYLFVKKQFTITITDLTHKVLITTAADDKFCNIFLSFWQK